MSEEPLPPKEHPLRASLLKIRRARKHLRELEQFAADYVASEPAKITYNYDGPFDPAKGPRFHMSVAGPSPEYYCILGDIIHNLRTSLDLMATDLVRLNGEDPAKVYFPFCEDAEYIDKWIQKRHFDKAGADAVALLKTFAPYKGGNTALRAIHDLDIQDKHQSLIDIPIGVQSPPMRVNVAEDGKITLDIIDEPFSPAVPLAFPRGTGLDDQEVIPTLHNLVELVDGVVEAFAALVAARGA